MQELTWWQKGVIGAIGGLALALLKLIDARFFLFGVAQVEAYAGYLTYFCYMLLGSVAAVFLADHELSPAKVRRSAFILGLLAPSVLLAIANQPVKSIDTEQRRSANIPSLGWLPLPTANAQVAISPQNAPNNSNTNLKVEVLSAASLKPSFANALAAAVGRGELNEPYAYVIGSTASKEKAQNIVWKIHQILSTNSTKDFQPRVVQVEGTPSYYVLLGELGSKQDLGNLRIDATSAAIKTIGSPSDAGSISLAERKDLATLLVNAPVLPASNLSRSQK